MLQLNLTVNTELSYKCSAIDFTIAYDIVASGPSAGKALCGNILQHHWACAVRVELSLITPSGLLSLMHFAHTTQYCLVFSFMSLRDASEGTVLESTGTFLQYSVDAYFRSSIPCPINPRAISWKFL